MTSLIHSVMLTAVITGEVSPVRHCSWCTDATRCQQNTE
jgi:hypothetical protein